MTIYEKLMHIQNELKVPKTHYNRFGEYYYRNVDDILEALKPLAMKYNSVLFLTDELVCENGRFYIKAIASLISTDTSDEQSPQVISVSAVAREEDSRAKASFPQLTGSASSYARKYALNALFNIDDTKDVDSEEKGTFCDKCGKPITHPDALKLRAQGKPVVCSECRKAERQ